MRMYLFKCNKCKREFGGKYYSKYCPYCSSKDIKFIPNKTVESLDILSNDRYNSSSRLSYEDSLARLLEALSPTTRYNGKTKKSTISPSIFNHLVKDVQGVIEKLPNYTVNPSFHNPLINKSRHINYYELRLYGRDRSICVATVNNYGRARDSYRNLLKETKHLMNVYLEQGIEYYLIPQHKNVNLFDMLLYEMSKRLISDKK